MDVERPVCGVDQELAARAVVLVALLYRAGVPVGPVHGVLKQRQGKRVRQRSVEYGVSMVAVQVRESETTNEVRPRDPDARLSMWWRCKLFPGGH